MNIKLILRILSLAAIVAPVFLTGTFSPPSCIAIHLFGIILFASCISREWWLISGILFLWFDILFISGISMPTYQNRIAKAKMEISEDQKRRIRYECDKELFDSINHYLKYPLNAEAIRKLDLGNSPLRDTLSIAITIAKKNIHYGTFFWDTDNAKIYKFFYYDSLLNTKKYIWGEKTEIDDNGDGPIVYEVNIYGYLPNFYSELEKRITLIKRQK